MSLMDLEVCILISSLLREHALCQTELMHENHATAWTGNCPGTALPVLIL